MPYPAKLSREIVLKTAMDELSQGGLQKLSLRGVAAALGTVPSALYRYFSDRAAIEVALAAEGSQRLEAKLRKVTAACDPSTSIRRLADAYVAFGKAEPDMYELMMGNRHPHATGENPLWSFTVSQVERVSGPGAAADATVALWAFLHGMVMLQAAGAFNKFKPKSGYEFGVEAWLLASTKR